MKHPLGADGALGWEERNVPGSWLEHTARQDSWEHRGCAGREDTAFSVKTNDAGRLEHILLFLLRTETSPHTVNCREETDTGGPEERPSLPPSTRSRPGVCTGSGRTLAAKAGEGQAALHGKV